MTTPAPDAPVAAVLVRAWLAGSARVTALAGDRISTRSPADVGPLHVVVQSPTGGGLDRPAHGVYRPLLLVEARAASSESGDPEYDVMAAAGVLSAVLSSARNVSHPRGRWTARDVSGPFALPVDESRGVPVFRGAVQAQLAVRALTTT